MQALCPIDGLVPIHGHKYEMINRRPKVRGNCTICGYELQIGITDQQMREVRVRTPNTVSNPMAMWFNS